MIFLVSFQRPLGRWNHTQWYLDGTVNPLVMVITVLERESLYKLIGVEINSAGPMSIAMLFSLARVLKLFCMQQNIFFNISVNNNLVWGNNPGEHFCMWSGLLFLSIFVFALFCYVISFIPLCIPGHHGYSVAPNVKFRVIWTWQNLILSERLRPSKHLF